MSAEWLYKHLQEKVDDLKDKRVKVGLMKAPVDSVFGRAMEAGTRWCSPDKEKLLEEMFQEILKDIHELDSAGWDVEKDGFYIIAPYATFLDGPFTFVRYGKSISPQLAWKLKDNLEDGELRRYYYGLP